MPGTCPSATAFVILVALVLACPRSEVRGQVAEARAGSEVARARVAFEATVSATLEPLNRKYATALRRLEKEMAIQRNYEAAIALRDERLAAEAMLADSGNPAGAEGEKESTGNSVASVEGSAPQEVVYSAFSATPRNGSEVRGDAVVLAEAGQQAEWTVDVLPAGGYEVLVTYASSDPASFQIKEHFFRLGCDASATGGAGEFKTVSFGTLKVTSRATAISLTVESISAGSPLQVREVKLVSNRD